MSFNGSGTFVINSSGQPVVANTVISSTVFNALTADLATGLSTCITKDGQTTPTANIPMGTFKFTNLGNGSAATDSATLGQVQASTTKLVTVTGSDTIAGTMTPALTAYASGQMFYFIAAGANTGAVTLNIDGLGARNVTRDGSTALAANDILSGEVALVVYDGTRFQLLNPANAGSMTVSNLTVTGTTTLSGLTASTALALDASKNVVSVTNTGTGNNVLATSPTLTTPNLGTPSAIVLTNASGTASININGTVGATTPNTGAFTTLSASSTVSGTGFTNLFASPPAIGATAANTGAFTNLSYTGTLTGGTGIVNIGSGQVYKDASGNVGIGTASPGARLQVSGATKVGTGAASNSATFMVNNPNATATGIQLFQDSQESWVMGLLASSTALTWANSGSEKMRLDSSGNLGIGTASPGAMLDVAGNGRFGSANQVRLGSGVFAVNTASVWASTGRLDIGTTSASDVSFFANNTERFRIETNGSIRAGAASAIATTATDGFLYVPTCAGTPTGTPTAITGMAPIVVDTTNNKMYFYSGGQWRDAGP